MNINQLGKYTNLKRVFIDYATKIMHNIHQEINKNETNRC